MTQLVSVIVEWENAKLSDLGRAERMLGQLGAQMAGAARKRDLRAELLVLYDSDAIDPAVPRDAIARYLDAAGWPGSVRLIPAPGQRYYEQKNKGAALSSGEILLFLDSDVVPEDGWLEGMLDAMDDTEIAVVGGEAYHATETLHDRLFAAFWAFPTRRPSRGVYRCGQFYANNLAIRREVFCANPFPDAPAFRGQCYALARSLRRQGIPIHRQGASRVSHPPPSGVRSFFVRALCQGHDAIYWRAHDRLSLLPNANPVASILRLIGHFRDVLIRVATRSRTVGLGPLSALAAIGLGFAFYICKFAGEIVSFFMPGVIRNNLSV